MDERTRLDPWFIHDRLVFSLLGARTLARLTSRMAPPGTDFAKAANAALLADAVANYIAREGIRNGATEHIAGRLQVGQLVWFDQSFYFKNVAKAFLAGHDTGAAFHAKLNVDSKITVSGVFNPQRVTSDSSLSHLKGRNQQFIFGRVDSMDDGITLRPILLGHLLAPGKFDVYLDNRTGLHPSKVDQFQGVNFSLRLERKDLEVLRNVPEDDIKHWFAEILGEPEVFKDWGGEQFDQWTHRMTIDGQHHSAAIMFKGPAAFRPMTIAHLGKNGDQIDRIAQTDADLLVVQHCHEITAPVSNMLKAYAHQLGNVRRYMLINGYDTIRIMRHFGYI